jgi:hypothetical protein
MTKHLIDCGALYYEILPMTRTAINIHVFRYSCKTDGGTPNCLSWVNSVDFGTHPAMCPCASARRLRRSAIALHTNGPRIGFGAIGLPGSLLSFFTGMAALISAPMMVPPRTTCRDFVLMATITTTLALARNATRIWCVDWNFHAIGAGCV